MGAIGTRTWSWRVERPGRGSTGETEVGSAERQQAEYNIHMCHRMVGVWVQEGMKATLWEEDLKESLGKTEGPRSTERNTQKPREWQHGVPPTLTRVEALYRAVKCL